MLESVDRSRLNGHDLVTLMQARVRQLAHLQAEVYADMVELAHCPPGDANSPRQRQSEMEEFASDEIRAALCWTRRAAEAQLTLAWQLRERLPHVWNALLKGRIDLPKARTIVDGTDHLDKKTARKVAQLVVNESAKLTTGQLRARIRRLAIQANPESAKKEYEWGLADRRVMVAANPDGTANLSGYQLPPDRTTSIRRKIDRLAKSLTSVDDSRTIDQIRADVFLDLLEGKPAAHPHASGVVDIQVDLSTLTGLADIPGQIPGWGPVIADITRQVVARQHNSEWRVTVNDPHDGRALWNTITRRRPTASQSRHVEARHPVCIFPGCRIPATDCDIDHTEAWAEGGPTVIKNLAPLCRHDHRLKHHASWQLRQSSSGTFTWTSPHGHTYTNAADRPP